MEFQSHCCVRCDAPMSYVSIPNDPFGFIGVWHCCHCDIIEGDDDFLVWLARESGQVEVETAAGPVPARLVPQTRLARVVSFVGEVMKWGRV